MYGNHYINVYMLYNGKIWYGGSNRSRLAAQGAAKTAIKNGAKLLYLIHVILK